MIDFIKALFNLQFFADAGSNVNATATMTNAYTGDTTARTTTNDMAPELKEYYDTELLENARTELFYAQFGKRQPLPKNHNGTVEWRKANTFPRADKLVEAVIPQGKTFGVTRLTGSIDQYGMYASVSDKLELRSYDDVIMMVTEEMGASAAETQEALIRNALLTGSTVLYCDNINPLTGAPAGTVVTPTSPAEMEDNADARSTLTAEMVNKAVTIMKKNRVPRINGKYYAVIHPSVAYDLRESEGWIEAHKYAKPEELFNGEIGELHGVRFIEDTFAPVLAVVDEGGDAEQSYLSKDETVTYATYFFGKDSFGIIDPEGGALEMIIHDKSEIGGPLNQFSTIGYKFETNGATILYPERVMRVMSCSSLSATDESNY